MNPYEILGVSEDASDNEIRKAMRKLVKIHHPDKGGDAAIFSQISRAFALVATEEKRKRFEEKGDPPRKPLNSMAIEIIYMKLSDSFKELAGLKYLPMISKLKGAFHEDLNDFKKNYKLIKSQIKEFEDLKDRFILVKGEEEDNFFAYAIDEEIKKAESMKDQLRKQMQIGFRALKILNNFEFKLEIREVRFKEAGFTLRNNIIWQLT